jgi:release factor glutamine methyltransferase
MDIYEPREDSYLLQKNLQQVENRVLDLGTGSGIQALTLLKNPNVREVIAVDINPDAVAKLKQVIKDKRKIKVLHSNLFEKVSGQFNYILFNPPYLPQDKGITDPSLYGGKNGWELSERFFSEVSKYLMPDGKILFLFSSLTNKTKINEILKNHLLTFTQIDQQKLAFEELFVYEISKTPLLRELESKCLENIHYFDHGKRGIIYIATQDKSKLIKTHLETTKNIVKVAIKVTRPDSHAYGNLENEAKWLKILNKQGIGPKLLFSGDGYITYRFVEGEFILTWLQQQSKTEIVKLLQKLLQQCLTLDIIGVNKEEMHHPIKHIVVDSLNHPTLLDFERCSETDNPKNVTQFIEFICRMKDDLAKKGITVDLTQLRDLAAEYKDTYNPKILENIFS